MVGYSFIIQSDIVGLSISKLRHLYLSLLLIHIC